MGMFAADDVRARVALSLTSFRYMCERAPAMSPSGTGGGPGGPSAALAILIRDSEPFLYGLARRLCRNEADARDLVQDTFEHALRASVQTFPANPRAWLATIMHNIFIDRCRKTARRPTHQSLDEAA